MNITESSLRNPAAALVAVALLLALGAYAVMQLPIQLLPDLDPPRITIYTPWRAAAPQEVEEAIIQPQEEVLRNIAGLDSMVSNISRGGGSITLDFALGQDMQRALIDVITNLNQAAQLPEDADEPVISVGAAEDRDNAATLQLYARSGSDKLDTIMYQDLVETVIEPRIARLPGVARLVLESQRKREISITVDPLRLAALGLSVQDVATSLRRATDVSGGFADVGRRQYTVRFAGSQSAESLGDLVVGWPGGEPIRLSDVADISAGFAERTVLSRRNGRPSYYMRVTRRHDANTVALLDELNLALRELNAGPLAKAGLTLELSFDASLHVRRAIALVNQSLVLGLTLAGLILWYFLRNLRATLVIALSIPVALVAALIVLRLSGHSLNVISLAGLAFAVGLAMDASIIVQESIARKRQSGLSPLQAALSGTREVGPALWSSTLTTVAIFLPILFIEGIEGQLFGDLAITLSAAVIASLLVSLTLVPAACAYGLGDTRLNDHLHALWERLADTLIRTLGADARARWCWIGGITLTSVLAIVLLMPKVDFLPKADIDAVLAFFITAPGTNIRTLESELVAELSRRLLPYQTGEKEPHIRGFNIGLGPGWNALFVYPRDSRDAGKLESLLRTELLTGIPDTQAFVQRASMINIDAGGGRGISMDLRGADLETLMNAAGVGMQKIAALWPDGTVFPQPALAMDEPELRILPDDRRLGLAGLDRLAFANIIRAYTDGLYAGEHFDGNRRHDLIIRTREWNSPEELAAMPLATARAGVQSVGDLAEIRRTVGPVRLQRVDGHRTVTLVVIPPAQVTLEEAIQRLETEIEPAVEALLPAGASIRYRGSADRLERAINKMGINFAFAIAILFAIMALLFRSAYDSLLVLAVMPTAFAGGMIALRLLNLVSYQSLDMLTMIGFIILLGLVVNNAILLVDQTRSAERAGLERVAAVRNAIVVRARPIFMSTLTNIFGMLPLMLMPGAGAEIYRGLAAVIVGGLLASAMLTLLLMPCLLLSGKRQRADEFDQTLIARISGGGL